MYKKKREREKPTALVRKYQESMNCIRCHFILERYQSLSSTHLQPQAQPTWYEHGLQHTFPIFSFWLFKLNWTWRLALSFLLLTWNAGRRLGLQYRTYLGVIRQVFLGLLLRDTWVCHAVTFSDKLYVKEEKEEGEGGGYGLEKKIKIEWLVTANWSLRNGKNGP